MCKRIRLSIDYTSAIVELEQHDSYSVFYVNNDKIKVFSDYYPREQSILNALPDDIFPNSH